MPIMTKTSYEHYQNISRPLAGLRVLVLTSGHEATDGRIYSEATSLQDFGAAVTVVGKLTQGKPGDVAILQLPAARSRLLRFTLQPWRCFWAARKYRPDIVHFHDAELLAILPAAKLWWRRTKFVYDVHEDYANLMMIRDWIPRALKPLVRRLVNVFEKMLARFADGIVGVTPPITAMYRQPHKTSLYNFISASFFDRAERSARPPRGRTYDVVHLGSLNRRRAEFLANTLREFHQLRPEARSLIVGAPDVMLDFLKERVPGGCDLRGKVPFAEVPDHLGNAKVGIDVHPWLLPHLLPALPVKVCEYMACGCAVVTSTMPVLDRLLAESGADPGAIVTIVGGNPKRYAEATLELVRLIDAGADPGGSLRAIARRHMSWESEAGKLVTLYRELVTTP
jgi:glycosyltransferase involved in cell wall biosynthesis